MSDTLADLSSWLPSDFLTSDDFPTTKTHFPNHHLRHPYDFVSSSSTESESDDEDQLAGLTHRFTRSVSLQERFQIPSPIQKRVFSGSPESTLNWNISSPLPHSDEDSWQRIYAAAAQIARMKMEMNMNLINRNDNVSANRNLRGPHPPHHHHRHHPNWMRENEDFIRQQHFHQRFVAGFGGRPVGFRQSACLENPRRQQALAFVNKPGFAGSGGGGGRPTAVVKKECAGTGVFLPRTGYSHESKKKPGCNGGHLPARLAAQSYNKPMDPTNPNIYPGFAPHHHQLPPHHLNRAELAEIVRARRHAAILAQKRRSTNPVGVPETKIVGPPEVVLPQEWTY